MPAPTLTLRQLNRATLARQLLLAREETTALRAIERLVGVQAQWPRPPFVALWSRVQGFAREHLTHLLLTRQVVRATSLRGTLHLMGAKDFVALRAALQPVLARGESSILKTRNAGADLERMVARARAFFDAEPRPFEALRDAFLAEDPEADARALAFAVRMRLPLVQVPAPEEAWCFPSRAAFAVAESWLGRPVDGGEPTPHALVLRYLAAYGPASVADVQAWTGLQGLKPVLAELRPGLVTFRDERGRELFDLPDAPRPEEDVPAPVRFLPEFDSLIVARADARVLAEAHRSSVFLSALRVVPTFLVDGEAAGTWKAERKKAAATLVLAPFAFLAKKARAELTAEGEALLRFLEPDARTFDVRVD